jgi:hypothetical protein
VEPCSALAFDLHAGTLNGIAPTAEPAEIAAGMPCPLTPGADGALTWRLWFRFLPATDRIEVTSGYEGPVLPPLLRANRAAAIAALGPPTSDLTERLLYQQAWGCLELMFDLEADRAWRISAFAGACPGTDR